ncbi:MAG: CHAT domain-containing protein [Aureispira sp.]
MTYSLSLLFIFCSFLLSAQTEDYIVKNNNQKVLGVIKSVDLGVNNSSISFKTPDNFITNYSPKDIHEWGKGASVYVPKRNKKKLVFMRRLTAPEEVVVLYEYTKKANNPTTTDLFLERGNTLTKVKPLIFRKQMRSYFADQPTIVALMEKRGVKKKDLLDLVEEYNDLVREKQEENLPTTIPRDRIINRQSFWDFDDLLLSTDEAARKYMDAIEAAAADFANKVDRDIEVNYGIGLSFFQQKQYTAAIPYLKKVRNIILEEQQQLYRAPVIEAMLGQIYHEEDKQQLAIGFNSNALQKWKENPPSATNRIALYEAYLTQGRIFQALIPSRSNEAWYRLTVSEEEQNWETAFQIRGLAPIRHAMNDKKTLDYNLALLNFNTALRLIDQLPAKKRVPKRIEIQLALGLLYFKAGDYPNAEIYYEEALSTIKNKYGKNHPQQAEVERRLSEIYLATQLYKEALDYVDRAQYSHIGEDLKIDQQLLDNINKIPFPYELLNSIATRGVILYERSKNNPSESELKKVLAHYAIATEMLYQLRNIYRNEGNKSKLGNITHKISQHAVVICNTLFEKTGNSAFLEEAFSYAELSKSAVLFETVQDLKSMKIAGIPEDQTILENGLKVQIAYLKAEVFYELQQGDEASKARIKILQERIRSTTEQHNELLKEFEQNYPAYYNLKYSNRTIQLSRLQDILSPDEVFLEYVATDSFIYTLAISKTAIKSQFKTLPYQLSFVVKKLQHALKHNKPDLYAKYGYFLYQQVLEDLESFVQGKKLIIAPDAELSYIPFGVLPTQPINPLAKGPAIYEAAKFLIQSYPICYNYSASMFLHSKQQQRNNAPQKMSTWAPDFDAMESIISEKGIGEQLTALPGAQQEAQHIADLFGSPAYLANRASELQFKKEANLYSVLHIATHGVVNDLDPLFSSLILRNEGTEDGILHAYELYNMQLNADLAVLSACNSGMGRLKKGEGVVSIARGFSYAGVPNIVMSKWPVSDWSTEVLMRQFYKNLKRGLPKDEALQQAKISYLKANLNNPKLLAPFYWGGFVLSGNTAPLPALADEQLGIGWILLGVGLIALLFTGMVRRRRQTV